MLLGYFTRVIMIDHKINYNNLREDVAGISNLIIVFKPITINLT